jgi:hypothetical protein
LSLELTLNGGALAARYRYGLRDIEKGKIPNITSGRIFAPCNPSELTTEVMVAGSKAGSNTGSKIACVVQWAARIRCSPLINDFLQLPRCVVDTLKDVLYIVCTPCTPAVAWVTAISPPAISGAADYAGVGKAGVIDQASMISVGIFFLALVQSAKILAR